MSAYAVIIAVYGTKLSGISSVSERWRWNFKRPTAVLPHKARVSRDIPRLEYLIRRYRKLGELGGHPFKGKTTAGESPAGEEDKTVHFTVRLVISLLLVICGPSRTSVHDLCRARPIGNHFLLL